MSVTNNYLSRHEDVRDLAKRIGKDMGSLDILTTDDKDSIVVAINELKQEQSNIISRIEALEKDYKKLTEQGLASEYSGTGWYKATDTGVVYNKDVPEGETYIFKGDPTEYISVYTKQDAKLYADRAATSNITDMSHIFRGDSEFNEDLSHWDTSNVINMMGVFDNASSFNGDITTWDTSNVTNMNSIFFKATSFNQDLSSWDTSNVTNMRSVFRYATSFNQDISSWDTSKATDMVNMFSNATSFNQDISTWDTGNVTDMGFMFFNATSFNQDLSEWCVSKISSIPSSFNNNTAANWTLPKPVWGTCPRGEDGS